MPPSGDLAQDRHLAQRQAAQQEIIDAGVSAGRLALSVGEAAAMLGISRASAYEHVRTGELPCIRLGRRILIPLQLLQELLEDPERV